MSAWDWVIRSRSQFNDIEHRMESLERYWKSEAVSVEADPTFDLVRSEAAVCELLRWPGGLNITGVEVHFVSDGVNRNWSLSLVVVPCHVVLCLSESRLSFFEGVLHPLSELVDCF